MNPFAVLAHGGIQFGEGPAWGAGEGRNSCTNLHAADDGPKQLTAEIETIISRLAALPTRDAVFSSLYPSTQIDPIKLTRRRPSGAKRRAWQQKTSYQRGRCIDRLRPWQIDALFEADRFARSIGRPLNMFLTVSWNNTRVAAEDVSKQFGRATKAMGQWLRRRNCPSAWIFTHENPGNSRPNLHMLVHVPVDLVASFEAIAPEWFDALDGGVHIRPRRGPRDKCLHYMVKGTDFITARRYGDKARKQGTIAFKRCGWTENLGVTARYRHGGVKPGLATGFR